MSPYKDKDKQRTFQREWQRKRRGRGSSNPEVPTLDWQLKNIEDLKAVLEIIVTELLESDELDLGVKARNLSSLLTVGLRMLEQSELESRMVAVEERLGITASQWR